MRLLVEDTKLKADAPLTAASGMFDPFAPDYVADPYAVLRGLRESEPIFYSTQLQGWIVTRHESIRSVMRDANRFSSTITSDPLKPMCPMARKVLQDASFNVPSLLVNNDPPDHTRVKSFMAAPFQLTRLKSLEPFLRETVTTYVDQILAGEQPADLVKALTWDVPALVLFKLMGVPAEDVDLVKGWAESRVLLTSGRPTDEEQVRLAKSAADFYTYSVGLIAEKVKSPADDYTSDLIRLRNGDDANGASLHEIAVHMFNLLFAGHETTSSGAANMFLSLLTHRDQWEKVCRGEVKFSEVVEESLRFEPPIQARRRLVREDVEIEGHHIPAGSKLFLMVASGNRDPERFENPEDFCPGRSGVMQHLTFGSGIHMCMGAPLARQELMVMLEEVSRRMPGLRMVEGQELEFVPNTSFRGVRKLLVRW